MNTYEVICVLSTEEEKYNRLKEAVKANLNQSKGKIIKEEDMGERELAYPIKKHTRGHYQLFEVEMTPDIIPDIEKAFKLQADILRYLIVKKG